MTIPFSLYLGDCLDALRDLPENSVDSVVTDPPYGIRFMGKSWDGQDIEERAAYRASMPSHAAACGPTGGHRSIAAEAGKYDLTPKGMRAFQDFSYEWAAEVLRVLKPGGHLLSFSSARTYHHMACGIEAAGFEIRDQIMWVFGSGFPKSLDVSKAIDKTGAASSAWFGSWLKRWREDRGFSQKVLCERCGLFGKVNRGGTIANWELGLGSPTVEQFNRICQVLNLPFDSMQAAEREVIGRRRVAPGVAFISNGPSELDITAPATDEARQWQGWGTALKPAHEPICVARKPLEKGLTVAANVLKWGTGAINVDASRIGGPAGRWPANLIHDGSDEVVALFPAQAGASAPVKGTEPTANGFSGPVAFGGLIGRVPGAFHNDSGSAARFFYCAKTSPKDRHAGLEHPGAQFKQGTTLRKVENTATTGNNHPTVKPTDLMAYLCRLVTPAGGVVLDPFMGSGSTGKAAMRERFQFIGCELDPDYMEIAQARIQHEFEKHQPTLF